MADFNQKKPGEGLTNSADKFRKQNLVKNIYPTTDSEGYSPSHPNAMSDGDEKGNGEANTGRINNLKTNLYGQNNEYGSGNIDSGEGYEPKQ